VKFSFPPFIKEGWGGFKSPSIPLWKRGKLKRGFEKGGE